METVEFGFKERVLQYYFIHQRKIHAWAASAVGAAILTISFFTTGSTDADYIQAREAFQDWKDSPADEKLAYAMRKSLRKVPGLERALEAEIAQTYLAQGLASKALEDAHGSLARLEEVSPLHANFAQTTLLIEAKNYQQALESAVSLKEQMEKTLDPSLWKGSRTRGGSILYVCNLLRIAFLQKQLNNGAGELAAWEEIRGLIEIEGESSAAAQLLQSQFESGKFSLTDFISQREQSIVQ